MSKQQTLLEKALNEPRRSSKPVDDEELDLMIALVNGDIDMGQAARAQGKNAPHSMVLAYRAFACIRDGIAAGEIPRIERTGAKNGKRE